MSTVNRIFGRSLVRGAGLGLVCAIGCWLLSLVSVVRGIEEWFQDSNFVNRGVRQTQANVVVVGFDDDSLADLNKPLAFISPQLAEVVDFLSNKETAAIGIDLMVPEELDAFPGLQGLELGRAAAQAQNVVLPAVVALGRVMRPLRDWRLGSPLGVVGVSDDSDHFLRRQQLAVRVGDRDYYYFSVELLNLAQKIDEDRADGQLRVAGRVVPQDEHRRVCVNFVGPAGTIPLIPFRNALTAARGGPPLSVDLRGAIVIIGVTATWMGDVHATPYGNGAVGALWSGPDRLMSGPEFQANVIATLLDGAFLTTPWWLHSLLTSVISGVALGVALVRLNFGHGVALTIAHHVFWRLFSLGMFVAFHRRVEMVAVLLTGAACYAVIFSLRWRRLRRMFGLFKSEAIVRALEDDPGGSQRIGEERVLTVMFADIRGFTAFSELHAPSEVVALLNAYFTAIVPSIETHGGSVNQYMGDGLMSLFGATREQPGHAVQAVRAAVAMVRRVHEMDSDWESLSFANLGIGIGIHTGRAVVGAVGSQSRLDYSAIGDAVNVASRIESENKTLGTEILISAATYAAIPPEIRAKLGCVTSPEARRVKGKQESLVLHRVVVPGRRGDEVLATGERHRKGSYQEAPSHES